MFRTIAKLLLLILTLHITLFARAIDIDQAIKDAAKDAKTVFVFLHRSDCGYCESMLEFTLDDDPVKKMLEEKFVYIHINIDEKDDVSYKDFTGNGKAFAQYIGYDMYPTSLFFDEKGNMVFPIPGYQEEGEFLIILDYIASGAYKKTGFRCYENSLDFAREVKE